MRRMPRQVRPEDSAWSQDLDAAIVAYGTAVRMQIIRQLRIDGPSMRYQIQDATSINPSVLTQSLRKLESTGVVIANLPAGERSTRALTYAIDETRANRLLLLIAQYVQADCEISADS